MDSYVVLDLETTGFSATTNNIIEIGAWKVIDGFAIEKFSSFVYPDCSIPYKITQITGIRNEDVANAPTIEDILPQFLTFIGDLPVVCHNVTFDCGFLKEKAKNLGYDFTKLSNGSPRKGICTLKAVKRLYPNMSHKLESCVEVFKLSQGNDIAYHRAWQDSYMTMYLYEYLKGQFGKIPLLEGEYLC